MMVLCTQVNKMYVIATLSVYPHRASLKNFVQKKNPHNVKELWTVINAAWNEFPCERLLKLIDSMPNRCKDVIKARGGPTRY